jgi:hypothetical protein
MIVGCTDINGVVSGIDIYVWQSSVSIADAYSGPEKRLVDRERYLSRISASLKYRGRMSAIKGEGELATVSCFNNTGSWERVMPDLDSVGRFGKRVNVGGGPSRVIVPADIVGINIPNPSRMINLEMLGG